MELHHDKHHLAYVTGANTALGQLAEARQADQLGTVNLLEKNLAFNGELAAAIDEYFGSFDAFRAQFTAVALGVQGSGWSILAWDSLGQRPIIEQLYDHQGNLAAGSVPLLLLDLWEHACYLQYQNVRADQVKAWWNVANWADVARRFAVARSATQGLIVS